MMEEENGMISQAGPEDLIQTVKKGLPQFIGFNLLFRLAGFVFFAPLTAWMTTSLIESSSNGAISNYDIASFVFSFQGLVFLTVVVTVAFVLLFFEVGGLTALAIALQRNRKVTLPQLFRFLFLLLPKLWVLSLRQFLVYLKYAGPALIVTGMACLIFPTKNDINYYLIAKPPAFWITVAVAALSGLVFAFFAIRRFVDWIHSVPLVLFAGRTPAEALSESSKLVEGRRKEVLVLLGRCLGVLIIGTIVVSLGIMALKWIGLSLAGERVRIVLMVIAGLAVVQVLGAALVGIVSMSALACLEARLFLELRPEIRLPDLLPSSEAPTPRKLGKFLKAGWVILLLFCGLVG